MRPIKPIQILSGGSRLMDVTKLLGLVNQLARNGVGILNLLMANYRKFTVHILSIWQLLMVFVVTSQMRQKDRIHSKTYLKHGNSWSKIYPMCQMVCLLHV